VLNNIHSLIINTIHQTLNLGQITLFVKIYMTVIFWYSRSILLYYRRRPPTINGCHKLCVLPIENYASLSKIMHVIKKNPISISLLVYIVISYWGVLV